MRISDWSSDVCSSDLLDSASARQLGERPTGHASRGVSGPPGAGATNLYMEAGDQRALAFGELAFQLRPLRSEEHPSELQSLMRISYAVSCLKRKKQNETSAR